MFQKQKLRFNLTKTFFATSALALVFSVDIAEAATITTNGDVEFSSNTKWNPSAPVNNDDILYDGNNHSINANITGRTISAINLNNKNPGTLTVTNSFNVGSIGDTKAHGKLLWIKFNNTAQTLNFTGTAGGAVPADDYGGVADIDFNGLNSILKISKDNVGLDSNYHGNKTGAPSSNGTIEIDATNVTISGKFWDNSTRQVSKLNVNDNKSVILNTTLNLSENVTLGNSSVMTVNDNMDLNAADIKGSASGQGTLNFEGDSTVNASVGVTNPISTINVNGVGKTVQFQKVVNIAGNMTVVNNGTAEFANNVTANSIDGAASGQGILKFTDNSIVDALIGLNNPISTIDITGTNKVVTFKKLVKITGNASIANNSTAQFAASVTANDIRGASPSSANVEFVNQTNKIKIDSNVGLGGKLKTLKVTGKTVEITKVLSTDKIEFTNPNMLSALELSGNSDLGSTVVTTSSTQRLHNIHISVNQNITGSIGTVTNKFGTIRTLQDNTIKVNTLNFYTDVNTKTNDTGAVDFIKSNAISYSLGDSTYALREIKFTENAEVQGSAYAKKITIQPGKAGSFVKRLDKNNTLTIVPYVRTTDGINLVGTNSTAFFGDLGAFRGDILTNVAGQGNVIFDGNAELRGNIGTAISRVNNVTFSAKSLDKTITLARDIHSNSIIFGKSQVVVDKGGTLNGSVTANDTNINFGQHILIFTGGNSSFTGSPVFNIYFDNTSNSHLTVSGSNSNVDFSKAASLTFNISDYSKLPPSAGRVYKFFRRENNGTITLIDGSKVTVTQPLNPFVKWSYNNGDLIQTRDYNAGFQKLVLAAGGNVNLISNGLILADPSSGGSASVFLSDLSILAASDLSKAGKSLSQVLGSVNPTAPIVVNTINNAQGSIISARINNTQLFEFRIAGSQGIAAGDGDIASRYGSWASPFYTQADQKNNGDQLGYESKSSGGSVGFDHKINDNLILGIAGTTLDTKVKYKSVRTGDKGKINSWLLSVYGSYNLSDVWFLQGITSFGTNKVTNSKGRITATSELIARSKYSAKSYTGELLAGYNHKLTDLTILTPMGGLRYARFSSNGYTEKDAGGLNLTVSKKTTNKLELVLGAKLAKAVEINQMIFTPEVHGFINYDTNAKSSNVDIRLDGMAQPMVVRAGKEKRVFYNIGTGITAKNNGMEYEIGYDANIANKYIAHQGSLKVRVNF